MIIRSQDKKRIVNLDNIDSIHANDYGEINAFNGSGNSRTFMGKYSTEEKVINVLDMICDACRNIAFIDGQAVVFNMPQDSEV